MISRVLVTNLSTRPFVKAEGYLRPWWLCNESPSARIDTCVKHGVLIARTSRTGIRHQHLLRLPPFAILKKVAQSSEAVSSRDGAGGAHNLTSLPTSSNL
jgi:hypothetical protein